MSAEAFAYRGLPVVHLEPTAVAARLRELRLSEALLQGAVQDGDEERQQCTPLYPRQSAGQYMWSGTVAGLWKRIIPTGQGWALDRERNFETLINDDLSIAIAVMGGDEFTGHKGSKDPKVRRKRGPVAEGRVTANYRGMSPLFSIGGDGEVEDGGDTTKLWFLLVRATDEYIYSELSHPIGMNESGYISRWAERIILPRMDIAGGVTPIEHDLPPDESGPVAVPR